MGACQVPASRHGCGDGHDRARKRLRWWELVMVDGGWWHVVACGERPWQTSSVEGGLRGCVFAAWAALVPVQGAFRREWSRRCSGAAVWT